MAQQDIGTTVSGYDFAVSPSPVGPAFSYLGSDYAFICSGNEGGPAAHVHAFKSTAQGAWSELDAGNAPNIALVSGFGNSYCVCHDGATAYVLYVRATAGPVAIAGFTVVKFNLTTGLWSTSTPYATPVIDFMQVPGAVSSSGEVQVNMVRRGAGDMIFYYSGPVDAGSTQGFARVYYATFDGTTFGAAVKIPAQTGSLHSFFPNGAAVDSAGVTHFSYLEVEFPFPGGRLGNNVWHVAMNASGTFGTPEIASNDLYLVNTLTFSAPITFFDGASEYLAFAELCNDDLAFTTQSHRVFYALLSGGIGALTWQNAIVSQGVYGTNDPNLLVYQSFSLIAMSITIGAQNGSVVVAWAFQDSGTLDGFTYESTATPFSGLLWTSAFSLITTSLSFTPAYQVTAWPSTDAIGIISSSVRQVSPNPGSEVAQSNFINVAPVTPVTISCGNPPGGQVGVNYSHTFPASGGTPPYTFSLIGGAFPEGLTLDSSTGVLSGIPQMNGDFTFTIRVTDSLSNSASVSCEIIIKGVPQIAGGMGCLPECFDYCAPASVESMGYENLGGDPAIIAGILGALMLGGGA